MNSQKKKVLIAEDDADVITVLQAGLDGYDFITAKDGKEAYEKIKSEKPDLIILDIMMPEINGADVNKKLKKDEDLKDIPVLIITGRPNLKGLFSDSGENKVSGFLEKPFSLEILEGELQKILNK
ncbi:MAG: response regulator [Elusimicrobiota bacterium]